MLARMVRRATAARRAPRARPAHATHVAWTCFHGRCDAAVPRTGLALTFAPRAARPGAAAATPAAAELLGASMPRALV
jgi:hypothetical protein